MLADIIQTEKKKEEKYRKADSKWPLGQCQAVWFPYIHSPRRI